MRARVCDYRGLVPRTPPEGLREWVLKTCRNEMDRYGLMYEVEYDEPLCDWPMAVPDDYKRTKMVRVTCSCCGDSMLLNWGKDANRGYGFVLPDDEEGDWEHTVTAAGDDARCPMCRAKVLVRKRSSVRDYYVSDGCHVMSADVLDGTQKKRSGTCFRRSVQHMAGNARGSRTCDGNGGTVGRG